MPELQIHVFRLGSFAVKAFEAAPIVEHINEAKPLGVCSGGGCNLCVAEGKGKRLLLAGEVIEMIWKRFPSPLSALFATIAMVCAGIGIAVADPTGLWLARDGAHVEIAPCGNEPVVFW